MRMKSRRNSLLRCHERTFMISHSLYRLSRTILVLCTLCLFVSCDNWSANQVQKTKEAGAIVQNALETYRKVNGRYPADLRMLTPGLLPEIPRPTVGQKRWKYEVFKDGASYAISVEIRSLSE